MLVFVMTGVWKRCDSAANRSMLFSWSKNITFIYVSFENKKFLSKGNVIFTFKNSKSFAETLVWNWKLALAFLWYIPLVGVFKKTSTAM